MKIYLSKTVESKKSSMVEHQLGPKTFFRSKLKDFGAIFTITLPSVGLLACTLLRISRKAVVKSFFWLVALLQPETIQYNLSPASIRFKQGKVCVDDSSTRRCERKNHFSLLTFSWRHRSRGLIWTCSRPCSRYRRARTRCFGASMTPTMVAAV